MRRTRIVGREHGRPVYQTSRAVILGVIQPLEAQDIEVKGAELTMIPTTPTEVDPKDAAKVMRLVDKLEELEDLQNVYHSMDMTDEVIAALEQED